MRALLVALAAFLVFPATAWAGHATLEQRDLAVSGSGGIASNRFDLIGFHWRGPGDVLFRTRDATGDWSRWQVADAEPDDLPDRGTAEGAAARGWRLGSPYWTGGSTAIAYRLRGRVTALRAFFVRSRGGIRGRPAPMTADEPPIITRAQWGADERIRRGRPVYAPAVRFALVHHTAGSNSYSASQSASIVRAIEVYHVRGNGWHDIGYNFLVDRYGQIFEGRYGGIDRAVMGAHAQGFNYGSVGVALIGTYSSTAPTAAARGALVRLLAWRLDVDHVDPLSKVTAVSSGNPRYARGRAVSMRAVSGHRDAYPTSCPGSRLYGELPAIARDVAATGLPKIYAPLVTGRVGAAVRFRARLSAARPWTVTVTDSALRIVAQGTGQGTAVDWTWNASGVRGAYGYTIEAGPNARPVTGTLGGPAAQVRIDKAAAQPAVVTPNGDGRGDRARISYRLATEATVTATLTDARGNALGVLFTGERLAGPHSFVWKDIGVADGRYRIVLTALAGSGAQAVATVPVIVDRTLAAVRSDRAAISPNGDGRADTATLAFTLFGPARVQLTIERAGRTYATLARGRFEQGSQREVWDGSGLRDGNYLAVVTAVDAVTTVTQRLAIRIDTKRPTLRLLSARRLLFWVSERAIVDVEIDGDHVTRPVRRGTFGIAHAPAVSSLRAVATDAAENRSTEIRRP
jgi:hypothetical protein